MTLETQKYLKMHSLEALRRSRALRVYEHPTLPLVGFKYTRDSVKTDPIVRECRGLVLEKDTWKLVAKPFNRFFNVGEVAEEYSKFNWSAAQCVEKVDGSLIILYNYDNSWLVNTSGSFGLGQVDAYNGSWCDLFWKYASFDRSKLFPHVSYIFELCTPYNRVVKEYSEPTVFLLGANNLLGGTPQELTEKETCTLAAYINAPRPNVYDIAGETCVRQIMEQLEEDDEMHEGVILRDPNMRWKWKTESYINAHHLSDNGNVILPKNLTRIVLNNDVEEVLSRRNDLSTALTQVGLEIAKLEDDLMFILMKNMNLSQKDFALSVRSHKFSWVLFQLRKGVVSYGPSWATRKQLRTILRENYKKVAEALFKHTTFRFDV